MLYILLALFICKWYVYTHTHTRYWFHFSRKPWLIHHGHGRKLHTVWLLPPHQPHLLPYSSSHWPFPILFLSWDLATHPVSSFNRFFSLLGSCSLLFPIIIYSYLSSYIKCSYSGSLPPPPSVKTHFESVSFQSTSHLFCIAGQIAISVFLAVAAPHRQELSAFDHHL